MKKTGRTPEMLVEPKASIHAGTTAKVVTADGITDVLDILTARRHPGPYLFMIVIDCVMTMSIDIDESKWK